MKAIFFAILLLPLYCAAQFEGGFYKEPVASGGGSGEYDFSGTTGYLIDYNVTSLGLNVGDLVSTLTDQGPNKWHAKSTGAARPYYTNNASVCGGKSFLYFTAANNCYEQTNFTTTISQPSTMFWVAPVSTTGFTFDQGGQNAVRTYVLGTGIDFNAGDGITAPSTRFTANQVYVWEVHWNNTPLGGDNGAGPFTNGVQSIVQASRVGVNGIQGLTVGARYSLASGSDLKLFRLLWFQGDLTNSNGTYGLGGSGSCSNVVYQLKALYGI